MAFLFLLYYRQDEINGEHLTPETREQWQDRMEWGSLILPPVPPSSPPVLMEKVTEELQAFLGQPHPDEVKEGSSWQCLIRHTAYQIR